MAEQRSHGEDVANELVGKAVMWGPAIAGAALLGPAGILVGLAVSVAIIASGNSNTPPPGGSQAPRQ